MANSQHTLAEYKDGFIKVEFCKKCGAEGLKLLEDCPQKLLDEKKPTAK